MKQILSPIESLNALCGEQQIPSGTPCRWTVFCMQVPCMDGVLFYHTLLGELLLLNVDEAENVLSDEALSDDLKRKWFLVPESFDDCQFSDQCRETALLMLPPEDPWVDSFTIFTTTDCNARCFYCYEKGWSRMNMTEQTAHDAVAYMLKVSGGKKLSLQWFGGEPLFNAAAIDTIVNDIRTAGREFTSSMVSNGYLFDEAMVRKAVEEWNLKKIQITLDGTEAVYNRTKAFIYKDGTSAWQRVMNAIDLLLKAEICVTVRLNVDRANAEDLKILAEILAARFGGRKNFGVYAHLLFDNYCRHEFSDIRTAFACIAALNERLSCLGIRQARLHDLRDQQVRAYGCMADNDHIRTILPDGHLGKCEHYSEDHFVGSIYAGDTDPKMIRAFKERRKPEAACRSCAYYPQCRVLVLCDGGPCTDLDRTYCFNELQYSILAAYQEAKKKSGKADSEETVPESVNC